MLRFFSVPILVGIALGLLFPYQSLSLIWLSSVLLFLLLFFNTLAVDKGKLVSAAAQHGGFLAANLILIFAIVPLVQTALAMLLLHDRDFILGVAVSSLAPCALVNPFFADRRGGDVPLALTVVVLSTLLCPFLLVPALSALGLYTVFMDSRYLLTYFGALTVGPLVLSLVATSLSARGVARVRSFLPYLNSFILALLMFILVGSALNRVPLRLLLGADLLALAAIFVIFDFGLFVLTRQVGGLFVEQHLAESLALSVSVRNFAVSANLMLVFHPKAALPSAVGLIVHCLFFQWLVWKSNDTRKKFV